MQFNLQFLDEPSSSYFALQILLPSRVTGSTKTLIDNIFCNIPQSSEQNTSANRTTDHLPQEELEKMISNHAPLRKTRKREIKFQSKPWITSGLQKSVVIKKLLFGKFIKSANSITKEKLHNDYKSYRNMISTLLKQSKKEILQQVF